MSRPCHTPHQELGRSRAPSSDGITFDRRPSEPLNQGQVGRWMNASICDPALGRLRFDPNQGLMVIAILFPEVGPRTEYGKTGMDKGDSFPSFMAS